MFWEPPEVIAPTPVTQGATVDLSGYKNPFSGLVKALREEERQRELTKLELKKQYEAAVKTLIEIIKVCGKAWISDDSVLRFANLELKEKPEPTKVYKNPVEPKILVTPDKFEETPVTWADQLELG